MISEQHLTTREVPAWTGISTAACLPQGKPLAIFTFFFFSWKKQRPVEQTELDSATCITTKEMVYKLKRLPTQ
jgi:hypothetical protein